MLILTILTLCSNGEYSLPRPASLLNSSCTLSHKTTVFCDKACSVLTGHDEQVWVRLLFACHALRVQRSINREPHGFQ